MIPLIFQNANVFVWSPEDWKKLRQEHRVVGNLFGSLPRAPFQNTFGGLPSILLEEEVTLLLEKKLARLVKYRSLKPSAEVEKSWEQYKNKSKEEQTEYIIADRKRSITKMIDRIVDGKRKKNVIKRKVDQETKTDTELEKEEILKAELEKVDQTPLTHSLVHTFVEDPWLKESDFIEVSDWKYPSSESESLRYKVYKDLWEKGYYVTCGQKFGGDFLVYPGDPAVYHAHYIVKCKDVNNSIPWLEITTHCRVGSSSRKTFVMAFSPDQETMSYMSFQFEGLTRCIL